jgi:hypothetical protein
MNSNNSPSNVTCDHFVARRTLCVVFFSTSANGSNCWDIVLTLWTEVIVGSHCCNNDLRLRCCSNELRHHSWLWYNCCCICSYLGCTDDVIMYSLLTVHFSSFVSLLFIKGKVCLWDHHALCPSVCVPNYNNLFTIKLIKFRVLWDVAPYSHVEVDRRFRGASFIHFPLGSQLEHRAPFGVSVITHTIRHTVGLLWTSDQPVAEASTYTGQHCI